MNTLSSTRLPPTFGISRGSDDTLIVHLLGDWRLCEELPECTDIKTALDALPTVRRLSFETAKLKHWDSNLVTFLMGICAVVSSRKIDLDVSGLPEGAGALLRLATAVPERLGVRRAETDMSFLTHVGLGTMRVFDGVIGALVFVGNTARSVMRLFVGRAQFRREDFVTALLQSGPQALPIVALISILVGLILAFVGAVQLQMFGAQLYVANLVAVGMTREMGAMMAAVIMAGRTGAAYAAQLGTMQVNEEIDALVTLGLDPYDFLVIPRILALGLMMPLLSVYADIIGIFGGLLVGITILDISPTQYWHQTLAWVRLNDFALGISKSVAFGIIIAVSGCLRGMTCGRSAAEVGAAATSAVVTAIVWIIVVDGLFAVATSVLGL